MVLDPFLTDIVTSLIANSLTELMRHGVEKAKKMTMCGDTIRKALEADTILVSAIRDVTAKMLETPLFPSNELQATMMQLFLESPTAESIVRQMYSDFLPETPHEKSTGELQKEFQICLAYHLGVNPEGVRQLSKDLFQVISMGCRKALGLAIEQDILSAHEAMSIARHRILLDEL